MTTVAGALHEARAAGVERLDAQLLLAHVLARPRAWLYAHDDAALDAAQALTWRGLLARRAAGEPVAYLVGSKEFHGLTLQVDARVLVPRPETELLVDWALDRLTDAATSRPRVVDLGTGSGAIALAVKAAWPQADVLATDVSEDALAVARANADALGLPLATCRGAWWDALDGERFDLVLSNPPYIAGGDPHLPALRHEPTLALTPGADGLNALRAIVAGAAAHLRASGWLLLEHGYDQADAVQALLREHGFDAIETRRDLAGQPRCTGGRALAATERTG
ncbi:peptide chain release factor N(5)-glutamine methyltransferase [Rhizobacter sp. Root404]|uniref:peptide chain release factor N(5)-glutamine methyltransferase n=1 Tax=Rhizobacter sp. Root404 TaxID=1736528 RepID=UPI0006F5D106|nr:peptide chain release factor N(5)-glutamine methyltransferase [Rhizobacter sp. Root404]KQW40143.1 protein-(glutamine-N5) methyltransferase, release factor-specific [Rhizobacter sp. Root404]